MGRTNKGRYNKYIQEALDNALKAVQAGMSTRTAAKEFGIPRSTLKDHANGKSKVGVKAGRKRCIPEEIENATIDKVIAVAQAGFPITKRQFLVKVGLLVKKMNLKTMFKDNVPGDDYWRCVKARRPDLVIRSPEGCNTNRMRGMNEEVVNKYFDDLMYIMTSLGLQEKPECIWNADETGMQFSPIPSKVLAKRGSRELLARTNNTKDSITLMVTINAKGQAMPPLCVTKGKTHRCVQSFATLDAPTGTVWTYQDNAWMNNAIGLEWFQQVFLKHCGPQRPQLLILDSHGSHEVVELLELARNENIHVLALPPHATHMLQPLDRVVFAPFKKAYRQICTEFMTAHPGHTINKTTWPRILKRTWETVMEPELLRKAFVATGIFPCNKDAIPRTAFAPSQALDRCAPPAENDEGHEDDMMEESEAQEVSGPTEEAEEASAPTETVTEEEEITVDITAEDVAALDGLLIEVEGGRTVRLDLSTDADLPLADVELPLEDVDLPASDWNSEVNAIFNIPEATVPTTRNSSSRAITGHRLLTSEEVYRDKVAQKEEKDRKEREKQQRKEKRMQQKQ